MHSRNLWKSGQGSGKQAAPDGEGVQWECFAPTEAALSGRVPASRPRLGDKALQESKSSRSPYPGFDL